MVSADFYYGLTAAFIAFLVGIALKQWHVIRQYEKLLSSIPQTVVQADIPQTSEEQPEQKEDLYEKWKHSESDY